MFEGKKILITGGTGSLGKVLVRRILSGECGQPEKIIILSRDEAKQHDMRMSYLNREVTTDEVIYANFKRGLEFRIGDVRNPDDVYSAVDGVDIVINAAALKQVPTCEYFPQQAVLTNCAGASNIIEAIRRSKHTVETVVGISTDKACKPINVMGMTKAIQERIFLSANVLLPETKFICVRYGNVMASRGSVIPLFHKQLQLGRELTITDPQMTRFLLNLNEAVDVVFAAIDSGYAGEIFVPRAPAATIENIAKSLSVGYDIPMKITGIRPGEKLDEIMVSDEEAPYVSVVGKHYAIQSLLPELKQASGVRESAGLTKAYSSGDSPLNLEDTTELLRVNQLLEPNQELSEGAELLR